MVKILKDKVYKLIGKQIIEELELTFSIETMNASEKEYIDEQIKDELSSPIPMETINKFEKEHNITLPNDFKLFYTTITDGLYIDEEIELLDFESIYFEEDYINKEFKYKKPYILKPWKEDLKDDVYNGNIMLFELGDGTTLNLIINGKQKGQIWNFSEVGITPLFPSMNFFEVLNFALDGGRDFFVGYEDNNIINKIRKIFKKDLTN